MVENHLIVVKKLQFLHQLFVLMWEVCQRVLAAKYSVVVELQLKVWKKALFSKKKWKIKVWWLVILELLKILQPNLIEKVFSFMQAIEEKRVDF